MVWSARRNDPVASAIFRRQRAWRAGIDEAGNAFRLAGATTTLALEQEALAGGQSLADTAVAQLGDAMDLTTVRLLAPIDHADPAHLLVSGIGLTHLGFAEGATRCTRRQVPART